jgi:membrane-associated protease RseP (regulator of RpoE activity)
VLSGPSNVSVADMAYDLQTAGGLVILPVKIVGRQIVDVIPDRSARSDAAARSRHIEDDRGETDNRSGQFKSVIGFTGDSNNVVERFGFGTLPTVIGFLNLSLGAVNLLPVWCLDGYGVLDSLVEVLRTQRVRYGVLARTLLTAVTVMSTLAMVVILIRALVSDLFG